jgi:sporulation integral membrane protein YlbJ
MRILILRKLNVMLGAALVSLLTLSLVIFPKEGVEAAIVGLKIFWEVVLPSLLPFFVLSEILLGMGVVHFIGVLLEPLMRPLFNVPGVGAFALSMGLAAGYPMDAVITGKFRRSGMCTQVEGERLLSFTNTADPLFIFGAVAVGMFGLPALGAILGIAHYLSSFTVGIVFKFYKRNSTEKTGSDSSHQKGIMMRAMRALIKARREDGRPLGKLMGDAVRESMATLLMIGGFIMLFSVLVKILTVFGVFGLINPVIASALKIFGIDPSLSHAVFNGILEIDLGTMASSQAAAPLLDKVMIAGWIIAWSGLSVHGQVASVIHDTDIRMGPYIVARFMHGIFAAFYSWILMVPLKSVISPLTNAIPVGKGFNPIDRVVFSGRQQLLILGILLLCSILIYLSKRYVLVREEKMKR